MTDHAWTREVPGPSVPAAAVPATRPASAASAGERPRKRILVLIDQAHGFTNFIAEGAFDVVSARHDVRVASLPGNRKRMRIDPLDYISADIWERIELDPRRAALWHNLALAALVRPGFSQRRRRLRWSRLRKIRDRRRRLLFAAAALPGLRWVYSTMLLRRLMASTHGGLDALLDRWRPDLVLHPSALNGPFINDLLIACRARGIPSVVLMNSWDNPSTKSLAYAFPDWLLVWGEQTRRHAVRYMGIPAERVVALGAPQLDPLRRHDVAALRSVHRARNGLGADEAVILYAASSARTGDFESLLQLERAIGDGRVPPCRVLYRVYPGKRHDVARVRAHPWRFVVVQSEAASSDEPESPRLRADRAVEGKLGALAAADAVISPLSTILLEAAMLGRPVLCYIPQELVARRFRRVNSSLLHFDEFLAMPDVIVAGEIDALVPAARAVLAKTRETGVADRLRAASRFFVAELAGSYPERLAGFVESLLHAPAAPELKR
jgi:hypothetical protein